ncbi:hypothetical protein WSM22_43840 [Cytophagales bacterium WSM2-2]|nr:hypothetical protein WSM22_43840 [Cytophagales bacterium WSM2-2]
MKIEEPDLSGSYSYADYVKWQWTEMVELIHGKIFKMSPAPGTAHQKVCVEFTRQIANHLVGKKCQAFVAPFDVRLPVSSYRNSDSEITTVVQPDVCVVCDPAKIDDRGCLGAPDWIIEILSSSTSSKDLRQKFDVYENSGVREYWIVHPVEQTVLIYILDENGKYKSSSKPFVREDKIVPVTLSALTIDLVLVFPNE